MNLKKALVLGAVVYITAFILNLLVSLALINGRDTQIILGISGATITFILLIICTKTYFKSVQASFKEGLIFGLINAVIGVIIDTIITLLIDASKSFGNLNNPLFWAANLAIISISSFIGWYKKRKQL